MFDYFGNFKRMFLVEFLVEFIQKPINISFSKGLMTEKYPQFTMPKGYMGNPQFGAEKSFLLTLLSGLMFCMAVLYENCSFLIWVALLPLLTAVKARFDAGVFLYGFLCGVFYNLPIYSWLGLKSVLPVLINSSAFGLWLWLGRKIHFFMVFPNPNMALAATDRNHFMQTWKQQISQVGVYAILWGAIESILLKVIEQPWTQLGLVATQSLFKSGYAYFGVTGVSIMIVCCNCSIFSLIENRLLLSKVKLEYRPALFYLVFLISIPFLSVTRGAEMEIKLISDELTLGDTRYSLIQLSSEKKRLRNSI